MSSLVRLQPRLVPRSVQPRQGRGKNSRSNPCVPEARSLAGRFEGQQTVRGHGCSSPCALAIAFVRSREIYSGCTGNVVSEPFKASCMR